MFQVGLNPYGLSYTLGLQSGGSRGNPDPGGLPGFIAIAREFGVGTIELDHRWLTPLRSGDLARLRNELADFTVICSFWLAGRPGETLEHAVRLTAGIGGRILRLHLTPVLEGARARSGPAWRDMVEHARSTLARELPAAGDAGLVVALENHQDLGSEELLSLSEALGDHVGLCFDTGNPYAVGEDPVAFAARAAGRIRHVHLKDYAAQFTAEGYRLVRCPIGDGCVPFADIHAVLARHHPHLTASVEPGALEARHIRLFTDDWWTGYPPRAARELGVMLGRLRRNRLPEDADPRTPWERGEAPERVVAFERAQLERSFDNLRALGWL